MPTSNPSGFKKNDNHLNNHQQKYNESVRQMIAQKNKPSLDHLDSEFQRWFVKGNRAQIVMVGIWRIFQKVYFLHLVIFYMDQTTWQSENSFDHSIFQNFIQNDDHCSERKFPIRNSPFPVEANLKNDMRFQKFKL